MKSRIDFVIVGGAVAWHLKQLFIGVRASAVFLATAIAVLIFLVACLPPLLLILHKLFPFHLSFLSPFIIVLHKPQY